ncbi:uncharacterized protein DS421_7g213120 [Arachis hypogaea]|nr:uncharacterized protein DS421_7g213120 [Arachis hypogaea]
MLERKKLGKKGNGELEGETEGKKEGNEEQRERVREHRKNRGRRIAAPCCSLRRLPSLSPEPEERERTLARERINVRRRRAPVRRTMPPLRHHRCRGWKHKVRTEGEKPRVKGDAGPLLLLLSPSSLSLPLKAKALSSSSILPGAATHLSQRVSYFAAAEFAVLRLKLSL